MTKFLHNIYCLATGHNRGFGIHSPLAYSTVIDAISPRRRYGLYVYNDISDMMRGAQVSLLKWRRVRRRVRMIARLAVFFSMKRFCIEGKLPEPDVDLIREALPLVGCKEVKDSSEPCFRILDLTDKDVTPEPVLRQGDLLLIYGKCREIKALRQSVSKQMYNGILFDGCNALLLICTPDTVLTEYKVRL